MGRRHRPLYEPAISRIVARQLGHITRGQLLALGFAADWIDHRVRTGELIPVHLGVYAVGHVPRHAHARCVAAVLACGDGAALSHSAAAALWDAGPWPRLLEVTAPRERRRPGIRTHRSGTLAAADVRIRHATRVTSPARTALDMQPRLSDAGLACLVNELRAGRHLTPSEFERLCARSARIDGLLGERDGGRTLTRSQLERSFRVFASRHDLPMPETNVALPENGREVDALYRGARLIVEIDSWAHHSDRASFERDRRTDAEALALGYRTLRITARRLAREGDAEAAMIRRILAGGAQ